MKISEMAVEHYNKGKCLADFTVLAVKVWNNNWGNAAGEAWSFHRGKIPWGDRFFKFKDGSVLAVRYEAYSDFEGRITMVADETP